MGWFPEEQEIQSEDEQETDQHTDSVAYVFLPEKVARQEVIVVQVKEPGDQDIPDEIL